MLTRLLLVLAAFVVPAAAAAHTRWFAYGELPEYVTDEPTALYLTIWALIAIAVIFVAAAIERNHVSHLHFLEPKGKHAFERAASTFAMVAGAFFLIAGTHEYLFSPNLSVESGIPMYLVVLQIGIGIAFLVGLFPRLAAIALGVLWVLGFHYAGVVSMLEDVWVLSTAVFIFVMGNDYFSLVSIKAFGPWVKKYKCYGLSILRWGTGGTLLVLGFSEKILHPEYGINFLQQYDWNFMQHLGFNYSDYLFTLSAGSVEALFGLIFIFGLVTRLNALILATVFTIPLFILGPIELAGHLPHFAAVILLLMFGSGGYFKLVRLKGGEHHHS